MDSILQDDKECFMCGTTLNLECHHVIFGSSRRKTSERLGLKIWLCAEHHRGPLGPHMNREADLRLRRYAQSCYEDSHSRAEWMEAIGRNYLGGRNEV